MKYAFLLALSLLTTAAQAAPNYGELVMTGPDSAEAIYEDTCSNGANADAATRMAFVEAMITNPDSKLAKLKLALLKEISDEGEEPRGEGVYISEWVQTFHDRDGCSGSLNSFSAVVNTVVGGNTNHTVAKYIATIDDDVDGGYRALKLRSIEKISIRQ